MAAAREITDDRGMSSQSPNAARCAVEPSNLSLLGLVRHLAEVERGWFRNHMAGQNAPPHYTSDADFLRERIDGRMGQ
jgi:Protein of unknown function (DUF664)